MLTFAKYVTRCRSEQSRPDSDRLDTPQGGSLQSCAEIRRAPGGHFPGGHFPVGLAGMTRAGMTRAGMTGTALLLLALGGCGHEPHKDSYPVSSGALVDGSSTISTSTGSDSAGSDSAGSNLADSSATAPEGSTGAILFMASSGDGKPPQLIARTTSVTTAPTAETLAREAIAVIAPTEDSGIYVITVMEVVNQ